MDQNNNEIYGYRIKTDTGSAILPYYAFITKYHPQDVKPNQRIFYEGPDMIKLGIRSSDNYKVEDIVTVADIIKLGL